MSKGNLFVFTGPSGTGKGTILKQVLETDPHVKLSVSATTRAPRPGEEHGVHYWFLSRDDFIRKIDAGEFLEHACYVGNHYGTLEAPVNEQLAGGYDVVLEIEVQGALQIHEKRPDAIMIFVAPPSFEILEQRLRGRGTETEDKVSERISAAKNEMAQADHFDYIVVNDDLKEAVDDVCAIMRAERCKNRK